MKQRRLEVILKTVERCNINCTYCYFFNGIDQSYLSNPKYISMQTIYAVADFLAQGCKELKYDMVRIYLHGGEPMMQKRSSFDEMCSTFYSVISPIAQLEIVIQTNGILVTEEWIDLFSKYEIGIGVSLDGPKHINDIDRIDHQGKGTYDRVLKGINLLQAAYEEGRIGKIAALCVINPLHSAKEIYRHLVDDLKIETIDFLLPDLNYEMMERHTVETGFKAEDYGNFLCDAFDEWVKDDNPSIFVRVLNSTLSLLTGGHTHLLNFGPSDGSLEAITISSKGDVAPDDTLRSANPELMNTQKNVANSKLSDCLSSPIFKAIKYSQINIANTCQECEWGKICRGGLPLHRYSVENCFDNPSVMCDGLKILYHKVTSYILSKGFPINKLENILFN
jgi:uncharacterized protein